MVRHFSMASSVLLGGLLLGGCGVTSHPPAALHPASSSPNITPASPSAVDSGPWQISAINFASAQDGVVAASNAHHVAIFRTSDGGHHWTLADTWTSADVAHLPTTLEQLGAPLTISFHHTRDGMALWYQEAAAGQMWVDIGRTTNGGRSWTLVTKHLLLSDGPNTLVMTGRRSAWLVNGAMGGPEVAVLRTTDSGRYWTRRTKHFPGKTVGTQGVALHLGRPGSAVLMTALAGFSRQTNMVVDQFTTNAAQTWRTVRVPMPLRRGAQFAYQSQDCLAFSFRAVNSMLLIGRQMLSGC